LEIYVTVLLQLAGELKAAKYAGTEQQRLAGKNIALIFEKDSTRTRARSNAGIKHSRTAFCWSIIICPAISHLRSMLSLATTITAVTTKASAI